MGGACKLGFIFLVCVCCVYSAVGDVTLNSLGQGDSNYTCHNLNFIIKKSFSQQAT